MKKVKILTIALISIFLISSCKTVRILPDVPVTGNLPAPPEHLPSQFTLPIEIDISSVETLINQKLPSGVLASDSRRQGNTTRYSYSVHRNKPVQFSAKGNELVFKVPLDIRARGSYTACVGFWRDGDCCSTPNPFGSGCLSPGITTTEHGNASPTVDVELRVKLEILEDYSVKAKTYLKGVLSGDTHLHVDLIGNLIRINIDISDQLEKPLRKFVKDYQKQIDQKVAELVSQYDLKTQVARYWEDIKQPRPMGDFWLDVQPQKVLFENLNAHNNTLRIAVGIASRLQVVTEKPTVSDVSLPNLTLQQGTEGKFNIYLPASTDFAYLQEQVKNEVVGEKYERDGVSVKIRDVELKGVELNNTSLILIKTNVSGKVKMKRFKGDLYFTAIPCINDSARLVKVEDFKIEANTNSFLISHGLPFLIDHFYYDKLKDELKYSYAADYEKYKQLINDEISEVVIDDLIINAELEEMQVPGFYIDSKSLQLLLIATGKLTSRMEIN